MSQALYRRKAILTRIRKALDAFYLLQNIDWEYDVRAALERILALALQEVELDGGKQIERGLIIIPSPRGGPLEVHAGWKAADPELVFSRTVVQRTIATGEAILCENAKDDPRFMEAESLKHIETLSLISVPLRIGEQRLGALYIESKSPRNLFSEDDLDFLAEFTDTITPYLKTVLTHQGHILEIQGLRREIQKHYSFSSIIGRSERMCGVFELVKIAAEIDRTVLITGESGTGKELIAHAIHHNSRRRQKPFIVVDCGTLSEHLLESELFGHRKGAFTGAATDKIGAFEEADGGTLFLDEVSDAVKPLQQKLRRVLQEGEIRRVGENVSRAVDVRVICATNKSLTDLVEKGEFIRDLYFRINRFPIQLPPLRQRKEDIPVLVDHFLAAAHRHEAGERARIEPDALALLVERDWAENNVRELRNTVELATDFSSHGTITRETVERVLRLQRGEDGAVPESGKRASGPACSAAGQPPASSGSLIHLFKEAFREEIERVRKEGGDGALPKDESPYYRLQLETSAKAIIEGLRAADWKLRPASRLLGISPTKLRCDFRDYVDRTLRESGGDAATIAEALSVPLEVLLRKAEDLGLPPLSRKDDP